VLRVQNREVGGGRDTAACELPHFSACFFKKIDLELVKLVVFGKDIYRIRPSTTYCNLHSKSKLQTYDPMT
jgi:hypothetical protein